MKNLISQQLVIASLLLLPYNALLAEESIINNPQDEEIHQPPALNTDTVQIEGRSEAHWETATDGKLDKITSDKVLRAILSTQIINREPANFIVTVPKNQGKIYFFTELADLQGDTITHVWEFNGQIMAQVDFKVKSPKYRVYSSKNILPEWVGKWRVLVNDSAGVTLNESGFDVVD